MVVVATYCPFRHTSGNGGSLEVQRSGASENMMRQLRHLFPKTIALGWINLESRDSVTGHTGSSIDRSAFEGMQHWMQSRPLTEPSTPTPSEFPGVVGCCATVVCRNRRLAIPSAAIGCTNGEAVKRSALQSGRSLVRTPLRGIPSAQLIGRKWSPYPTTSPR